MVGTAAKSTLLRRCGALSPAQREKRAFRGLPLGAGELLWNPEPALLAHREAGPSEGIGPPGGVQKRHLHAEVCRPGVAGGILAVIINQAGKRAARSQQLACPDQGGVEIWQVVKDLH